MATTRLTAKRAFYGFALAISMLVMQASQAAAPQDAILGTWLTDGGESKVDVVADKAADGSTVYSGKVTWLKDPTRDGDRCTTVTMKTSRCAVGPSSDSRSYPDSGSLAQRRGPAASFTPRAKARVPGRPDARAGRPPRGEGQRRYRDKDRVLDALS